MNYDPLQYLNRAERVLVGWAVRRRFAAKLPRFAKWIETSGPRAAVRFACAQTFTLYIWVFGLTAAVVNVAGLNAVAYVLYAFAGLSLVGVIACLISALKPQREYRKAHGYRG